MIAADREAARSFLSFVRMAWHVLEPVAQFIAGRVLQGLTEHVEAIHRGEILRFLANVPPGTMKSLLISVFFNAWEWGPMERPDLRFLSTSYSGVFAARDTRKTLTLIESPWFQERWPTLLTRDAATSFANDRMGTRDAIPFGSLTGGRGDRLTIDDPHSTETAESDAERKETIRIFRESVPNRINNPKTSAIIVIMQRLNKGDVTNEIDRLGLPYEKFVMPMEFETQRKCYTILKPKHFDSGPPVPARYDADHQQWYPDGVPIPDSIRPRLEKVEPKLVYLQDWRAEPNELLWPDRFDRAFVDDAKRAMGSYATAAQYQQRPVAREGGLFKRHFFKIVKAAPSAFRRVRRWDLGAGVPEAGKDPDRTAGVRMLEAADGSGFYIDDVVKGQLSPAQARALMRATASIDGPGTEVVVVQDPGQAGKDQVQQLILMLAGYRVFKERETTDKGLRAEPLAAQAEAGNLYLIEAPWNEEFIDELCGFPGVPHDDMFDAAAGAFNRLAKRVTHGGQARAVPGGINIHGG